MINAVVSDVKPLQITNWSWVCTSQNNGANGCDGVTNSAADFTDTVNLPNGASIEYTVTAQVSASATGNLVNTASVAVPPAGYTDTNPGNNSATDVDTPVSVADLQITKTDGVMAYLPGNGLTYTIVVTNNGPGDVVGAFVSDPIPAQITTWTWTCTSQNNGASGCDGAVNSAADFTDTVNLPSGASLAYTVTASVSTGATGNLVNTATVTEPFGITDPNTANNSATDINYSSTYGNIGPGQDGGIELLPSGSVIVMALSPAALVNGDLGAPDIIFYEQAVGGGIDMDRIILEIGDGTTWYTILNWGDGISDVASSIAIPLGAPNPTTCAGEPDNCQIVNTGDIFLTNGTGVRIDLDHPSLGIPSGSYPFIRISVPLGSGNAGIDGIYVINP